MKRIILGVLLLILLAGTTQAQNSLEGRALNPVQDPVIDMFIGSWTESVPVNTHGSITERAILTPLVGSDVERPGRHGAVLRYAKRFTRATLDPLAKTTRDILAGEQLVFYIDSGIGIIETDNTTAELCAGTFVLVPSGCPYTIENTCTENPLVMYLIAEQTPRGFRPNDDILVRDEMNTSVRDSDYLDTHWVHNGKNMFNTNDGLATLEAVNLYTFDPMTVSQPHSHDAGAEEVWTVVSGRNLAFIGKELRWQEAGTAYKVPPTGHTPHANINQCAEPVKFLMFARWEDHAVRP